MTEDLVLEMSRSETDWYYDESSAKIVSKPWGKEVWLNYKKDEEIGDFEKKYVMKKLYIQSGTKTSFQYHLKKVETNFLIQGSIEAWFESKPGFIEKKILKPGSIWSIPAGVKHRIITMSDVILMESSSPEVDDVIRVEDDFQRGDGRIKEEHLAKE